MSEQSIKPDAIKMPGEIFFREIDPETYMTPLHRSFRLVKLITSLAVGTAISLAISIPETSAPENNAFIEGAAAYAATAAITFGVLGLVEKALFGKD